MEHIRKVVIKSTSGFCCVYQAFHDKITITQNSVSYEYTPEIESEYNQKRKWSYKTSGPRYKEIYGIIAHLVSDIITCGTDPHCLDTGEIEFIISFDDKTSVKKTFWASADCFAGLFKVIKDIIPPCEYMQDGLLSFDDREDEE